ncbi:hypothetical protein ACIBSV_01405 [Embleya sp. NPDC050154]|uniref:hypothetical protein n=1 Tax=unclassified Embleya TaxID=2699296 RepID=UPI0037A22F9B
MDRRWVVGLCWRCEQVDVPVLWLGPVHTDFEGAGPFYVCEPCIRRLEALVRAYQDQRAGE